MPLSDYLETNKQWFTLLKYLNSWHLCYSIHIKFLCIHATIWNWKHKTQREKTIPTASSFLCGIQSGAIHMDGFLSYTLSSLKKKNKQKIKLCCLVVCNICWWCTTTTTTAGYSYFNTQLPLIVITTTVAPAHSFVHSLI